MGDVSLNDLLDVWYGAGLWATGGGAVLAAFVLLADARTRSSRARRFFTLALSAAAAVFPSAAVNLASDTDPADLAEGGARTAATVAMFAGMAGAALVFAFAWVYLVAGCRRGAGAVRFSLGTLSLACLAALVVFGALGVSGGFEEGAAGVSAGGPVSVQSVQPLQVNATRQSDTAVVQPQPGDSTIVTATPPATESPTVSPTEPPTPSPTAITPTTTATAVAGITLDPARADELAHAALISAGDLPGGPWEATGEDQFADESFLGLLSPESTACAAIRDTVDEVRSRTEPDRAGRAQRQFSKPVPGPLPDTSVELSVSLQVFNDPGVLAGAFEDLRGLIPTNLAPCLADTFQGSLEEGDQQGTVRVSPVTASESAPFGGEATGVELDAEVEGISAMLRVEVYGWTYGNTGVNLSFFGPAEAFTPGFVGYVIELTQVRLEQVAGGHVIPTSTVPPATVTVTTTTVAETATFAPQQFALDVDADDNPVDPVEAISFGPKKVVFFFTHEGMTDGRPWKFVWYRDGAVVYDSGESPWEFGEDGTVWVSFFYENQALERGTWSVEIVLEGAIVLQENIQVE